MFALTAPLAIYGYKRRTRFVALILIGLSALNVLATSNTESGENSELVITIPVLAAGVLFLIASFVDKQDDSAEEK
jgi:phosphatidylserine synthase